MKHLLIISIVILILVSCGKQTTIKGKVYNTLDGEGITDIEITLGRANESLFPVSDGPGGKIIAETRTDSDGNYVFQERIRKNKNYSMAFKVNNDFYFAVDGATSLTHSISQENQTIDLSLVPVSYIKHHIKNIDCFDGNDEIEIFSCNEILQQQCTISWGGQSGFKGCFEFTTDNYDATAAGNMFYHWKVTKNNEVTHHYDTLFLEPFEEHYYEILY